MISTLNENERKKLTDIEKYKFPIGFLGLQFLEVASMSWTDELLAAEALVFIAYVIFGTSFITN